MNSLGIMLFLAALPVVLILLFIYNKDRSKEPLGLLLQLFILGILSCFIVAFVSTKLSDYLPFMQGNLEDKSFFSILLYAFLGVALIEELCKWIMLYLKGYKNDEYDELYDIIVYSVFVSLGFAFFENILYVINTQSIKIALIRAVSAIPGHACDAIFMGYYLNLAKIYETSKEKKLEKKNIILSILIPTILHGIYDFCLMSGIKILTLVFIIFITFLYKVSLKKVEEASINNKKFKFKNKFCKVCGKRSEREFCPNCGMKQE